VRTPIAAIVLSSFGLAHAQTADFNRDCAKWIAQRGYSRDYIELKTGKIQSGWPVTWRANVENEQVQAGDVVMYALRNKERRMRVAFVEEVSAEATDGQAARIRVTEMNWGKYTEESCLVTDHFGRVTSSNISMDTIQKVWRPSLPLPPAKVKSLPGD
jgi:hypothetical protein